MTEYVEKHLVENDKTALRTIKKAGDHRSPLQKTITQDYFFHSRPLFSVMLSKRSAAETSRRSRMFDYKET